MIRYHVNVWIGLYIGNNLPLVYDVVESRLGRYFSGTGLVTIIEKRINFLLLLSHVREKNLLRRR